MSNPSSWFRLLYFLPWPFQALHRLADCFHLDLSALIVWSLLFCASLIATVFLGFLVLLKFRSRRLIFYLVEFVDFFMF